MSKVYCTGAVQLFAGVGAGSGFIGHDPVTVKTPLFIGFGEQPPEIQIQTEFDPVMNDVGGNRLPIDRTYQGEEGLISVVLNKFNYLNLLRMMRMPEYLGNNNFPEGSNSNLHVGTLMNQEGFSYPVWLRFPYSRKPAFSDMPPGYRFHSCHLIGPKIIKPGSIAKRIHVTIKANRLFAANGAWTLYDRNMSQVTDAMVD